MNLSDLTDAKLKQRRESLKNMKRNRTALFCRSAFLLVIASVSLSSLAPSLFGQKIKVEYDKATDFLRFKSYAWVGGTPASNPNMDTYITFLADAMLEKKGMRRSK